MKRECKHKPWEHDYCAECHIAKQAAENKRLRDLIYDAAITLENDSYANRVRNALGSLKEALEGE